MKIPKEVQFIIEELNKRDFEAYIVGGCVRDLLRGEEPEDWDVATNAKPEEIQKVFPKNFYENNFLTVTVQTDSPNPKLKEIEITTYRSEAKYTDKRHPDEIKYAKTIEEDLARRDFTVNAIAIGVKAQTPRLRQGSGGQAKPKSEFQKNTKYKILNTKYEVIDSFDGRKDLEDKIIRAVGNAEDRFNEDALRMMRATRLVTTLGEGWRMEEKTAKAIKKNAPLLQDISKERIRDEFLKIIMTKKAADGVENLRQLGLLKYIVPELEEGYGVSQNKHHTYECYEHNRLSLKFAAEKGFNIYVRLAALLHDIGKPRVKAGEGPDSTFYSHEIVGAKMTSQILNRLKFSKKDIEKITKLVRYHLFYYNVDEVSDASVRRLVRQAGPENMEELIQVRMSDRIGSGVPKAEPYKIRHLKYVIDKVAQDPISAKMLKVDGNDIMKILDIKPGPKVGQILDVLLGHVLADPKKNNKEFLKQEVRNLGELNEKELLDLAQGAKKEREKIEIKRDEMTKKKYWVS